jgi:hypothetical protein
MTGMRGCVGEGCGRVGLSLALRWVLSLPAQTLRRVRLRGWGVVVVALVGRFVRAGGEGAPPDDVRTAWGAGQVYRAP